MRSTNPFLLHSMGSAVNYLALDTQCIKYPHAEHSHIIEIVYSVLCVLCWMATWDRLMFYAFVMIIINASITATRCFTEYSFNNSMDEARCIVAKSKPYTLSFDFLRLSFLFVITYLCNFHAICVLFSSEYK